MSRLWIALGAAFGLLTVGISAWTAHAAFAADPARAHLIRQALDMQGLHAGALLAAGLLAERRAGRFPHLAGGAFALGLILFCGALYVLALSGTSLGRVAPTGGVLLMLGWLLLAVAAIKE